MVKLHGIATAALLVAGCVVPSESVSSTEQAITVGPITGVIDRGVAACPPGLPAPPPGNCPASPPVSCRYYELYANPNSFADPDPAHYRYLPIVSCSDTNTFSALPNGTPSAKITCSSALGNCGPSQINVAIIDRQPPPGTTCWFQLEYSKIDYGGPPGYSDPGTISYSNTFGPVGAVTITSAQDQGASGNPPRDYFLLDGKFPISNYTVSVSCNGVPDATAQLESCLPNGCASPIAQLRISIAARASPSSCVLQVRATASAQYSNTYDIRVGGAFPGIPSSIGVYYWGSYQPPQDIDSTLTAAVTQLTASGFRSLRMPLYPSLKLAAADFPHVRATLNAQCSPTSSFLDCAIGTSLYQAAFNTLPIGTQSQPVYVVLTAYDSASTGPYGLEAKYVDPVWMGNPANQQAVRNEYKNLSLSLYATQQGKGRRFVIANWETDNAIYCGSAYSYVNNDPQCWLPAGQGFRNWCDAQTPNPAGRRAAMTQWFRQRKLGIQDGTAAAIAAGYTQGPAPSSVYDGIEFNSYNMLRRPLPPSPPTGYPSTLYDVIPAINPSYALYSAWESAYAGQVYNPNLGHDIISGLDGDLAQIRSLLASTSQSQLAIGELGGQTQWHMQQLVEAAYRANLPFSMIWQGFYRAPGPPPFTALLAPDGSESPWMRGVRSDIIAYAQTGTMPPQAIQIYGVRDAGVDVGFPSFRWFELYGSFPPQSGTSYSAIAFCMQPDGVNYTAHSAFVGHYSSGQINIRIPNVSQSTWCSFNVARGAVASPLFGPKLVP